MGDLRGQQLTAYGKAALVLKIIQILIAATVTGIITRIYIIDLGDWTEYYTNDVHTEYSQWDFMKNYWMAVYGIRYFYTIALGSVSVIMAALHLVPKLDTRLMVWAIVDLFVACLWFADFALLYTFIDPASRPMVLGYEGGCSRACVAWRVVWALTLINAASWMMTGGMAVLLWRARRKEG